MNRVIVALLFCLSITIHNKEEALFLPAWTISNSPITISSTTFLITVTIITIIGYGTAIYYVFQPGATIKYIFIGYVGAMWINAFLPHILFSLLSLSYMPGTISAVLILIPIHTYIIGKFIYVDKIPFNKIIYASTTCGGVLICLIAFLFFILS
ncbi:HXXEE domain-containing protein [Ornithinibacillus sp. 4-3]|uniref:HXXEE domain-containing protein n=1 Tax=Ornithinibacillus sp. 4-3 TaxID=3231488 RepID=A0AB39HNE7_9BACI